jgi:hypothetical protein
MRGQAQAGIQRTHRPGPTGYWSGWNRWCLAAVLALSIVFTGRAETLLRPKPPGGYSWQECPDIGCAFLKPKGWHYKHVERKTQHACFITKEDIDTEGTFKTGLTVNMILLSHLKTGISASEYAKKFIVTATKEREQLKRWSSTQGPFKAHGCIIRDDSGGPPVIVQNLVIANDKTGTIYVVLYEAPEAEYEEAWKIGEPILRQLIILDDSEWLQPIRDERIPVV